VNQNIGATERSGFLHPINSIVSLCVMLFKTGRTKRQPVQTIPAASLVLLLAEAKLPTEKIRDSQNQQNDGFGIMSRIIALAPYCTGTRSANCSDVGKQIGRFRALLA